MKKLIKNKICGPINRYRALFTEDGSKIAVTDHIPYMNGTACRGKKGIKKQKTKKRENAE